MDFFKKEGILKFSSEIEKRKENIRLHHQTEYILNLTRLSEGYQKNLRNERLFFLYVGQRCSQSKLKKSNLQTTFRINHFALLDQQNGQHFPKRPRHL